VLSLSKHRDPTSAPRTTMISAGLDQVGPAPADPTSGAVGFSFAPAALVLSLSKQWIARPS
jgi:hypothetical protein